MTNPDHVCARSGCGHKYSTHEVFPRGCCVCVCDEFVTQPNDPLGLGPLPVVPTRVFVMEGAKRELESSLIETIRKHNLTTGEQLQLVASVMAGHVQLIARFAIRQERHGNMDTPGDTAKEEKEG